MEGSPKRQKPEERLVLTRVPTSIPRHVTSLILRNCGITFVPNVLLECTWLKKINLSENHLTDLPETVGNWTSLSEIDLWGNRLIKLPEAVGNWTSLKKIYIECNQLTELPKTIGNWISLEVIYLWENDLTELPEAVGNWTSLKVIYLYDNQVRELPDAVGNWVLLEEIFLPERMKCPRVAQEFIEYYSLRLKLKKEATLLYWVLKKVGLPRDLANLGRKAVWAFKE